MQATSRRKKIADDYPSEHWRRQLSHGCRITLTAPPSWLCCLGLVAPEAGAPGPAKARASASVAALAEASGAPVRAMLAADSSPKRANARARSARRGFHHLCLLRVGSASAWPGPGGGCALRCCGRLIQELSAPTLRGKLGRAQALWHEQEQRPPRSPSRKSAATRLACSPALPGG